MVLRILQQGLRTVTGAPQVKSIVSSSVIQAEAAGIQKREGTYSSVRHSVSSRLLWFRSKERGPSFIWAHLISWSDGVDNLGTYRFRQLMIKKSS